MGRATAGGDKDDILVSAELQAADDLIQSCDKFIKALEHPIPLWAETAIGQARAYCSDVFLTYCEVNATGSEEA